MAPLILLRSTLLAAALILAGAATVSAEKDDRETARRLDVSQHEAEEIAAAEGIVDIREIEVKRGNWKIEGTDADGHKVEIVLDGYTGEILKFERYGAGRAGDDSPG